MKRILPYILLAIVAVRCKTESDVEPSSGSFIRYFGSENNLDAKLALEDENGYTLLSNLEIQDGAAFNYKIRLIHTDRNGNLQWQANYPVFSESDTSSMKGSSFIPLANSGYLITGDRINADGTTDLLLLRTDLNGNMQDSVTISGTDIALPGASLHGNAVMQLEDNTGAYFVALARIDNGNGKDMFVARFNAQDLSIQWKRQYGAGSSSLINKIYTNTSKNLFWAGSVTTSGHRDVRLVEAPKDSESPIIGDPIVSPTVDEIALDFCQAVGGWAITGSSNASGNEDIYLLKVSNNSEVLYQTTIKFEGERNDRGNSICPGADGGLVILGTVESESTQQDLYLTKRNAITGDMIWEVKYGGEDREEGASVRTTSDGSYLVFGTTYFGRARKLMLMKVKQNGQL